MQINSHHWFTEAKQCPSPFCDARPDSIKAQDISLLVIHNISLPPGQYGGDHVERFFLGQLDENEHTFFKVIAKMKVSAHCFIKRTGEVVQFVPFDKRAWHAGKSSFAGIENCNDYSIGIELEGTDLDTYTKAQYQSLIAITKALMTHYPQITLPRITGHQYIAPLRKTDPGLGFDWRGFKCELMSS